MPDVAQTIAGVATSEVVLEGIPGDFADLPMDRSAGKDTGYHDGSGRHSGESSGGGVR